MKQLLTLVLFCVFMNVGFSQQNQNVPPASIHCQLSIDQILSNQVFDIDDPIAEDARYIVFDLWGYLSDFYSGIENNIKETIIQSISDIEKSIEKAQEIGLDLSMFDEDFEIVNTKKEEL